MRAVADSTVLSNLANVHRAELLFQLFGNEIGIPAEVRLERTAGERLRRIPVCDWSWLKEIRLTQTERVLAGRLRKTVDAGEAACLAAAFTRSLIFLTDDRDARRLALLMRIPISGTLGILQSAVDAEYLDLRLANKLLAEMIRKGYRSPVQTLRDLAK